MISHSSEMAYVIPFGHHVVGGEIRHTSPISHKSLARVWTEKTLVLRVRYLNRTYLVGGGGDGACAEIGVDRLRAVKDGDFQGGTQWLVLVSAGVGLID
jgi:hypothetical protein